MRLDFSFELEAKLTAKLREWREAAAAEAWIVQQLLPHVDPQIGEQILIDHKVHEMDPDFSFYKTLFKKDAH